MFVPAMATPARRRGRRPPPSASPAQTGNCGTGCSGFDYATEYIIGSGLGCRYDAGHFTGLIDEVRLYDAPMSAGDVAQLYIDTK